MTGPIFIGGAARSGTTLVRAILDSHSRIACGPELKIGKAILEQWQETRQAQAALKDAQTVPVEEVDRLYRELFLGLLDPYREATGKVRVAEKSPGNVFLFQALGALFPEALFVHVIRDGRDVVASLLRQTHWKDAETGEPLPYTQDAETAARYWVAAVEAGRRAGAALGPRYMEIGYERLVAAPAEVVAGLCGWLGEPFEEAMLSTFATRLEPQEPNAAEVARPIHRSSVGGWRLNLTACQIGAVMRHAGGMLAVLDSGGQSGHARRSAP